MKKVMTFVVGTIFGIALSVGVLFGSGHMVANGKEVTRNYSYIQFDGFSFK